MIHPDGELVAAPAHSGALTEEQEDEARRLAALGYVGGYEAATDRSGVTRHDPVRAQPGLNLYTSGHAPVATLMDMDGRVLHEWRFDIEGEVGGEALSDNRMRLGASYMRRVQLYPEGGLLALYDWVGLVRLDRSSRRLWSRIERYHHDLRVLPDGRLLTLGELVRPATALGYPGEPILDNFIAILDEDGNELRRVSLLDCFARRFDTSTLQRLFPRAVMPDVFHANSVQMLDGSFAGLHPAYAAGNVLVSIRTNNVIAVIDLENERVAVKLEGPWRGQHEARASSDGRILLFDNLGRGEASRLLEIDIADQGLSWQYTAARPTDFYSQFQGTQRRLANGNILVTESGRGRAFELTREKEVVWEYSSPHRATDEQDLVAVLFDMERIEASRTDGWLEQ